MKEGHFCGLIYYCLSLASLIERVGCFHGSPNPRPSRLLLLSPAKATSCKSVEGTVEGGGGGGRGKEGSFAPPTDARGPKIEECESLIDPPPHSPLFRRERGRVGKKRGRGHCRVFLCTIGSRSGGGGHLRTKRFSPPTQPPI